MPQSSTTPAEPLHTDVASNLTSVTAVVPVRNEENHIARTLDQLLDQNLDGIELEILVVDGESSDQTQEIVKGYTEIYSHIRLLKNPNRLSSAARNIAIKKSKGEYIVIIDGHCEIPNRSYFIDLVAEFNKSGADCLGRPQPLDVTNASPLQIAIALARSSRLGHHPESYVYSDQHRFVPAKSVAVAYRRDVFEKVGLFDEEFDAHEDGEFNYRCDQAGLKCYLDPKLTVNYFPRSSLNALFNQMVRYGRGRVRLMRKYLSSLQFISRLSVIVPITLVYMAICSVLPVLFIPIILAMVAYLTVISAISFREMIRKRDAKLLFLMPAVFFVIHTGAGSGILIETYFGGLKR